MKNSRFIPLSVPNFEGNEEKYVLDAVRQTWVSTGGAYINTLEEKLALFLQVPNVAAVQSGTAALHLALREADVGPGDAVIVPTITFIAAVNPVKYCYAEPIFMDCDDSLCMDPVKLRKFIEFECRYDNNESKLIWRDDKGKEHVVKAIVAVHVFGNMADMEEICSIAESYHLKVIEDATEALGTRYVSGKYTGAYAGSIGDYGCYSFNGNKIITTGGGGAITAKDSAVVDHLRYLSTQAKDDPHYYVHNEIGFNYRMTNVQAAIGAAQMEKLNTFIERKNKNYALYKKMLDGFELAALMPFREGTYSNRWFYSLVINREKVKVPLRSIIAALEQRGIQTRAIWDLIHEQKPYRASCAYDIKRAVYYADRVINIPCSTNLTEDDISFLSDVIKEILIGLSI